MAKISLDSQLDLIEQQLDGVNVALLGSDPLAVQAASAQLQQLAVNFMHVTNELGRGCLTMPLRAKRMKTLASAIAALRENLLRRSAYIDRALEMVVPATQKSTYAGSRTSYGNAVRQSGAFKVLSA
jgi:hypothetical protein